MNEKHDNTNGPHDKDMNQGKSKNNKLTRRSLLKAFVGLPVLGFLGYQISLNSKYNIKQ